MHARPAMKLFELMQNFDAEVLLRNDEGTEAEANSVIALLMLDSAKGATDRGGGQRSAGS
ncbi:phosphocarrier protein [Klebsiella pneumoniae subsp. ozaenae]|uniref:Phosphocarrier protein NPr n=1 Tax=Klebsiella pneumoniae subsp. ozaenae TaxID=574 RepID=A0A377YYF4_KLEPO|nr:phosphocarrier protein [Klebsiella pneumoniae subsp. ozaenae]